MRGFLGSAAIGLLCAIVAATQPARAEEPAEFYKGKLVTILVGYSPGGSASFYSQALARHMGKYLPGNPKFVVQHMPGAGGLLMAEHLYNAAPRDGTVFGITVRTAGIAPLLGNTKLKFDGRKFGWIGSAAVEYSTCFSWQSSQVKTLDEATKKEVIVGAAGADATASIWPRAVNALVGTKFKIVTGYPGSNEVVLALERGEIDGYCSLSWTYIKLRKPDWLAEKKINLLFQMGVDKHPDLPDVPLISDYAKTPEDRQIFDFLFAPQAMGRPFLAPPGLPAERLQLLRKAFEQTLKDPDFVKDAQKLSLEVEHVPGEKLQEIVDRLYALPRSVLDRAAQVSGTEP
ncbi:MAG TPA: tripartite tricarboxylate transporter substrate-binding protein [Xanthobacteraceae bacterium]|nr:tripartite tricarboxylate transporter substrate-binding protein [Xanthobacteraceae bacterium]